ncbi:MAG: hypothetical protein QG620_730 [Patescibacteria group bacterium]|nr:hypothetical protein [Patescibacteria group bacterium]
MALEDNKTENNKKKKSLARRIKLFLGSKISLEKKEFFQKPIVYWLIIAGIVANAVNWGVLAFLIKQEVSDIILHYNVYFGVDATGGPQKIYIMPLTGLALFFINLFLATEFYAKQERIASYLMLAAALMIQLSLLIASTSIIIINY